jgi:hypothetical protein
MLVLLVLDVEVVPLDTTVLSVELFAEEFVELDPEDAIELDAEEVEEVEEGVDEDR